MRKNDVQVPREVHQLTSRPAVNNQEVIIDIVNQKERGNRNYHHIQQQHFRRPVVEIPRSSVVSGCPSEAAANSTGGNKKPKHEAVNPKTEPNLYRCQNDGCEKTGCSSETSD